MVENVYNSSIWEAGQEDLEFEANLGYMARPCLNTVPASPQRYSLELLTRKDLFSSLKQQNSKTIHAEEQLD
jgi:hypothetical protein